MVWSPAGQIGWSKSVFLQTKATHFERMVITVNEVNRDKTKVPDYFLFVMFRLSVLLLNSMSKLIHNRCTCKFIIKTLRLHTCMQMNNCVFVWCFNPLFSVVQLWNYTKTIIRLRLSEYCWIIVKYKSLRYTASLSLSSQLFAGLIWVVRETKEKL